MKERHEMSTPEQLAIDRCERLQEQIDTARDLLRASGIEGFGSLAEGIVMALRKKNVVLPTAVIIGEDETNHSVMRMIKTLRSMDDVEVRRRVAVKLECTVILASALGQMLEVDTIAMLEQIESQLGGFLNHIAERKAGQ